MKYSEIEEELKVTIGNNGKEIWEILDPIQLAFDDEDDNENFEEIDKETARVYCEKEGTGELAFIPIQLLVKAPLCPKCQTTLKLVSTKKGKFLGCRNYPKCSHYTPVKYEGEYTRSNHLFEGTAWNH